MFYPLYGNFGRLFLKVNLFPYVCVYQPTNIVTYEKKDYYSAIDSIFSFSYQNLTAGRPLSDNLH